MSELLERIQVPIVPIRRGESLSRVLAFANDRQPVYLYLEPGHVTAPDGERVGLLWLDWARDFNPSLERRLASGEILRWPSKPWTPEAGNALLIDPRVQRAAAGIIAGEDFAAHDAELSALAWEAGAEVETP